MRKRILVVLACVMAFGWTCLSAVAASEKSSSTSTSVSDSNSTKEAPAKKEKKAKKNKKGQKKVEDANSTGKKA